MKKLTIITICYNEPDVEKTLKSVVFQTYQDFEWIVIDGGSEKKYQNIFKKYKSRMDVFISESDKGIYNAMNKGIKKAHGKYINFLNAGDFYKDKNALKSIINELDKDVVYGDSYIIDENNNLTIQNCPDYIDLNNLIVSTIPHQSSFIRRSLFRKYGLYNENYKIVSDWEKWIIFYKHGCSFKYIHTSVSVFNLNGISSKKDQLLMSERRDVLSKYFTRHDINIAIHPKLISRICRWIFSIDKDFCHQHRLLTVCGICVHLRKKGN